MEGLVLSKDQCSNIEAQVDVSFVGYGKYLILEQNYSWHSYFCISPFLYSATPSNPNKGLYWYFVLQNSQLLKRHMWW